MKKDKNRVLQIVGICILFVFAFLLLIDKQRKDNLGDIADTSFGVATIKGQRLVVRDLDSIYPHYLVVYFDNSNNYVIHSFNFYQTESQYDLEYHRLLNHIIDYDRSEYMIRYTYQKGVGSYDYVFNNIENVTGIKNLKRY